MSAVKKSASSSSPSTQNLNGRCERSTRATVSVMMLVPKRSLSCQLLSCLPHGIDLMIQSYTSVWIVYESQGQMNDKTHDCARNLSIISGPVTPSGNPGKFSTSVVVVNCPPGAKPFASIPSYSTGLRLARAR